MSAPTPGNFDCAKLLEVKLLANQIFQDGGTLGSNYIADGEAGKAVLANQTARFEVLKNPSKDREVKAYWVDDCDEEVPTACDPTCEIDGAEIGTQCKDYALTDCITKGFSVTENVFRTSHLSREEVAATALLKKLILMDNALAKSMIEMLDENSGTNAFTTSTGGQYTVSGDLTYIPAAAWNADIFVYLAAAMRYNKLGTNAKMLSGANLYQYYQKILLESGDQGNASSQRKFGVFGMPYFDLFQLDATTGAQSTFLFDPNTVAHVGKAKFSEYGAMGRELVAGGHKTVWGTVASPTFGQYGVTYDMIYQEQCVTGRDVKHVWNVEYNFANLTSPVGCTAGRTGILQFVCGIAP